MVFFTPPSAGPWRRPVVLWEPSLPNGSQGRATRGGSVASFRRREVVRGPEWSQLCAGRAADGGLRPSGDARSRWMGDPLQGVRMAVVVADSNLIIIIIIIIRFLAPFRLAPLVEGASRRRAAPAAASDRAFSSTDRADVRLAYDAHTAPACRGLCVGVLRLLAVLAAAGDCTPSARSVLHYFEYFEYFDLWN